MKLRASTKVLLVDDEPNILVALEFLVTKEGYQVYKASNGKEALERMYTIVPDIVVLDVMMPEMDGFEVAKAIRTDVQFSDTKIVFLTAKGTQQDRFRGYDNGAEVYITKPFDNDELINTLNETVAYG
ncbi:MAG: response regulator [Bacteroidota bacterium]